MLSHFPLALGMASAKLQRPPRSIHADARDEADKHKWIESERIGRDLGHQAIEEWYRRFWSKYCRARRLEHLIGVQQFIEFADHEFGRLEEMYQMVMSGNEQLKDLIAKFENGWENLQFMTWVHKEHMNCDEIKEIILLLEIININLTRLEPRLHPPHH